jgi:hypothetical protein
MGLFFAWAIGESIVFYRWGKQGAPPTPGVLVQSSALFAGLALISLYGPARTAATVTAYALDLAILLQVIGKAPETVTGWPPPPITDTSVVIPTKGTTAAGSTSANAGPAAPASSGKKWNIWTGYL